MKLLTALRFIFVLGMGLSFAPLGWAEPPNLSLLRQDVKYYHDSGLYQKELSQRINAARQFIIAQAKLNKKSKNPHRLALVLDIDETSLSNYQHMVLRDFSGSYQQIHAEIMAADAPAIKPMLALYRDAQRHGIKVFFVTGRRESERSATEKNLKKVGYTHWSGLYLRPNAYSRQSIIPFKSKMRAQITKKGYTIIATIGDQFSDIRGGYAVKGFKLPNPYYYLP